MAAQTRVIPPSCGQTDPQQIPTPDSVEIFCGPGAGVVLQWWAESKVRWAEQNRLKPAPEYKRGS